jgi:hypothetical protein
MSKKLLSESQVNRWAKLSGVKLNENYGGMTGQRDDEMGGDEGAPEVDGGMGDEMPEIEMDAGAEGQTQKTIEDDDLMAMLEKAVENVLVKMGLGDAGEVDGGGDEIDSPDTDMDDMTGGEEADEEEAEEEEEEETLDETLEIVSDDEVINETLKRVIKRLVG